MPSSFHLDENAYAQMLDGLMRLHATDKKGAEADVHFINDDFWLQDTAVVENIEMRHGEWNVYLVFAHHLKPLKFIKRKIVHFACPKKASITAHYMRRLAAKDQRGTLSVDHSLMKLIFN
jgi:hypothetical protein